MNNNVSLLEIAKELIIDFFKRFYENGWAARFVLAVFILVVIPFPLSIALIMMEFVAMPYGKENKFGCIRYVLLAFTIFVALNPFTILMTGLNIVSSSDEQVKTNPKIEYGEFPCKLEYEVDGERYVYSDTLICEYKGYGWYMGFENTDDDILILDGTSDLGEYEDKKIISLYFDIGYPEYHMGLSSGGKPQDFDEVNFIVFSENTYRVTSHMPAEAAYEKFGFRFISWECAPPIENNKYK